MGVRGCWRVWFRLEGTGLCLDGGGLQVQGLGAEGSRDSTIHREAAGPQPFFSPTLSFAYVSGGRVFSCTDTCFH